MTQVNFSEENLNISTPELGNEWLLPDGVNDVLFSDADKQQYLRHHLIEQLQCKGYELVTPPLIEFTESLLSNASEDLKRQTFKIIDQLTGRLMGLRADTTPQILRIDAKHGNGIARYCYAGHTIHTLPTGLFGLRTPLQLGAEIFGSDDIHADFELLQVVCELFQELKLDAKIHLDIGHVCVFRRLSEIAGLSEGVIDKLMQLYANKALPELKEFCSHLNMGNDFYVIAKYGHDLSELQSNLSDEAVRDEMIIKALSEIDSLCQFLDSQKLKYQNQAIDLSVDVSHLSGYHYHSGIMFNMYVNGGPQPLVRGGRFGSNKLKFRPAIGFSMDVTRLLPYFQMTQPIMILVSFEDITNDNKEQLINKVEELRNDKYRVIIPISVDDKPIRVSHMLKYIDNSWRIESIS